MNICLGHFDEKKWETMFRDEQKAFMDECFACDDQLRKDGHSVRGEALCSNSNSNAWRNSLHHSEPLYEDDPSLVYPYGCHESSPASPPLPGGYRSPRLSNSYGAFAVMFVAQYDDRISSILRCSVSGSCQALRNRPRVSVSISPKTR